MSRVEMIAQRSVDEMATDISRDIALRMEEASPAVMRLYSSPNRLKRDLLAQVIRSMRETMRRDDRIAA